MAVNTSATEVTFTPEGVVYAELGSQVHCRVAPKSRSKVQVAVLVASDVIDITIMDPAAKRPRTEFLAGLQCSAEEREVAGRLLLVVAEQSAKDCGDWARWQLDELKRKAAEQAAERQEADTAALAERITQSWASGKAVLQDPALLHLVGAVAGRLGLAGEELPARLLYLVWISRVTNHPINVVFKGGSSGGKSFLVKTMLRFLPDDTVWELTAMSEKALIYSDRNFEHTYVIIYEYVGGEAADYCIRSLQSEGCLRYVTVEKTDAGLVSREISKPGPTGFISTTTAPLLHAENENRIWTITIDESEAQTRAVLGATAAHFAGTEDAVDLNEWHAAQTYLACGGATSVVIPFAAWLAKRMPDRPLRMRRDFGRLLALIETSALLFQAQRDHDGDSRVIAAVADYSNAYVLAQGIFGDALLNVPRLTRDVLDVVQELYDAKAPASIDDPDAVFVTYLELIERTGRPKYQLSRLLGPAFKAGLLDNLESRRGALAKLVPQGQLLGSVPLLPAPRTLAEAFPDLANAVWVHPLTGEIMVFPPVPPARSGSSRANDQHDDDDAGAEESEDDPAPSTASGEPNVSDTDVAEREPTAGAVAYGPRVAAGIDEGFSYRVVSTEEGLQQLAQDLAGVTEVALDLETTSLSPRAGTIRLISVTYVPYDDGVNASSPRTAVIDVRACPAWQQILGPVLARDDLTTVVFNAKFDVQFLLAAGVTVAQLWDPMLAAQLIDGGLHGARDAGYFALGAVVEREFGQTIRKDLQTSDWTAERLTDEQLRYSALDAAWLLPVRDALQTKLERDRLGDVAALEFAAVPAVAWLEAIGAPFDDEAWRLLSDQSMLQVQSSEGEIRTLLRSDTATAAVAETLKLTSTVQIKQVFAAVGIDLPDTKEETIAAQRGRHPLVDLVLAHREAAKLASTYGLAYLKHVDAVTNRIHASYHQIGAATGRMSCSGPNLQQVPRHRSFRDCFRAPPGRVIVKVDLSLIELCVAADLSGDTRMLQAITNGDDLHRLTTGALFGLAPAEVTKAQRAFGKAVNFATLYGQGRKGLIELAATHGLQLSVPEAAAFQQRFARAWPQLTAWQRNQMQGTGHVVRTASGRLRRVGAEGSGPIRANTPVQGSAADGYKAALALLWERREQCPSAVPILAVHDELVVEVDIDEADAAVRWVTNCLIDGMKQFVTKVPIRVEAIVAGSWAEPETAPSTSPPPPMQPPPRNPVPPSRAQPPEKAAKASTSVHFSSKSNEWTTPRWLFDLLDAEFHFQLDAAATVDNALCDRYFTAEDDGLRREWTAGTYCNPPYGRDLARWVAKAAAEATQGRGPIVCLIPARTDTRWWHDSVLTAAEIRFIKGRLRFGESTSSAPFPSAVVIFRPGYAGEPTIHWWEVTEPS